MGGWVGGWIDGWMDGWMDGWTDGWTDRRMDKRTVTTPSRDAERLCVARRHCTHCLPLVPPHITMHFEQDAKPV